MPYKIVKKDNKYCVYKHDDKGNPVGAALGCHATKTEATQQLKAVYANESRSLVGAQINHSFVDMVRQALASIFTVQSTQTSMQETAIDRALSLDDICAQVCDIVEDSYIVPLMPINPLMTEEAIEEMNDSYPYVANIYLDGKDFYAIICADSKLYRYPILIDKDIVTLGEPQEVVQDFTATMRSTQEAESDDKNTIGNTTVIRQTDGRYRWFSVSSTAILNRVGEIDTRALYDSFIEHINRTGEYPKRDFLHTGNTENPIILGDCDFVAREGYCLLTSGLYRDTPLGRADALARMNNPNYWGDSIEFIPTESPELVNINGINIPAYTQGVMQYITTLPESNAAAWLTAGSIVRRKETKMHDKLKAAMRKLLRDSGVIDENEIESFIASGANIVDRTNIAITTSDAIKREGVDDVTVVARAGTPISPSDTPPTPDVTANTAPADNAAPSANKDANAKSKDTTATTDGQGISLELDDKTVSAIVDALVNSPGFSDALIASDAFVAALQAVMANQAAAEATKRSTEQTTAIDKAIESLKLELQSLFDEAETRLQRIERFADNSTQETEQDKPARFKRPTQVIIRARQSQDNQESPEDVRILTTSDIAQNTLRAKGGTY